MSLRDLSQKRLLLIGPPGSGKSSTGNFLTERNYFTVGERRTRVTTEVKIKSHENGLMIGDFPGFGSDVQDDDVFSTSFLAKRNELEERLPVDALVLVIQFDIDVGIGFNAAAHQLTKLFGRRTIQSLMILCIQGNSNTRYADDDFENVIRNSDGFKYLTEKNHGQEIPFCLWDNLRPYRTQINDFIRCLENRRQITSTELSFIFDMVENDLENRKQIRRIQNTSRVNNLLHAQRKACIIS